VVNHSQKTLNLSEDKSKLILIDFWNTWCSACLMNLPKITSLQQKFGDRIRILPVSNQDKPALEKFFASQNGKKFNTLTSVYNDSISISFSARRCAVHHLDQRWKTTEYDRCDAAHRRDH
jgi:thiol-disulfide isomerase/thioredoxin